ncbi:GNAT family N-acetyltransferase [Maridesulfovibrio salexigens]|uniref:GCN5-related N-acetyltransferase n=1 Tax=Maridesulfovibrio salexigens (strain ATCC 14822 / DSM 2638 / NCIMB 8403 / VKM B-1763) TaxID=526222 RepID=C6BSG6_MARSD|nr:GNAT family N-acetyltransferase [Maridesulfovibrio salexigens]ACS79642.1 GCN5-related N-acetyltransferase [Maridesulfovibrio salexigens DSM 2638]
MFIETQRLILRPLKLGDAGFLSGMMKNPDVYRYILKQEPWSEGKIHSLLQKQEGLFARQGYCLFGVEMKGSRALAGYCGVQPLEDFSESLLGQVGISWVFQRDYWGAGLATESASAFLDYAYLKTDLQSIKALIHPANRGSMRVASKLGFEFDDLVFRNGRLRVMYSLLKEKYSSESLLYAGRSVGFMQPGLI